MKYSIRLSFVQREALRDHLFPGDGKESVALLLCGRTTGPDRHIFLGREVCPVPDHLCRVRTADQITWPASYTVPFLEKAAKRRLGVLKVHSHPNGYNRFSATDDRADHDFLAAAACWTDDGRPHASAVMLRGGKLFGRVLNADARFEPVDSFAVVGDDVEYSFAEDVGELAEFTVRTAQAFGEGTAKLLSRLSIGVVGCSGTGCHVVEMLHRLGVRRLVLVDPDDIDEKNLNRIPQATLDDARKRLKKVDVMARAIKQAGLKTDVVPLPIRVEAPEAILALAGCDFVFGCMDSVGGRDTLNRIATFYLLPYVDVGVRLDADGAGGISQITTAIHYLKPGGSSLLSRGVYQMEGVRAEHLRQTNRAAYDREVGEGYLRGVNEDRPAVIPVNMNAASMAVMEMLARLHQLRDEGNGDFAYSRLSHTAGLLRRNADGAPCPILAKEVGRGDTKPLLDRPET